MGGGRQAPAKPNPAKKKPSDWRIRGWRVRNLVAGGFLPRVFVRMASASETGASSNDLLMQIQADVLGCQVVRGDIAELSAFGAAMMVNAAEATSKMARATTVFRPTAGQDAVAELKKRWWRAIESLLTSEQRYSSK